MVYGLPVRDEVNWDVKLNDSISALKGEQDGRLSDATLSATFVLHGDSYVNVDQLIEKDGLDDTTAWETALASQRNIFAGRTSGYDVSRGVTLGSNHRVWGRGGKNAVTIRAAADFDTINHAAVVTITGTHPSLAHLQVDATLHPGIDPFRISAQYEPHLAHVKAKGGNVGFNLLSGLESRFEHCSATLNAGAGFYIQNTADAFLLNCSTDGCEFGFRGLGGSMTFIHCHAIKSTEHGFYLVGPSSSQFYGCHADTNDKNGFHVTDASNVHFTDCWSFKNGAGLTTSYNWLFSNVAKSSVKGGGSNNETNVTNSFFFTGTNEIALIGATADTKDVNTRAGVSFIGCTGILASKGMTDEVWLPASRLQPFGFGTPTLRNADTIVRWSVWLLDPASVEGLAGTLNENQVDSWTTWHVDLLWANENGGGAGDVRWRLDSAQVNPGSTLGSLTSGTAQTATAGAARVLMKTRLVTGGAVPSGDLRGINLLRLGTDAADTLANDVMVVGILLTRAS